MSWWSWLLIGLLGLVAFVAWDFRRFSRARAAEGGPVPEEEAPVRNRQLGRRAVEAAEAANAFSPPEPSPVTPAGRVRETISVVLCRQVPPRFDEPPRSWIGGLPMLPEDVEWPRSVSTEYPERGERPLHFVAQIACADLPADLWGGLGPREGWLLFFVDPNMGCPDDAGAFRVMHTSTLGHERAAPFDLGPVHDGVYTGPSYDYCRTPAEVPVTWRRWPVDLVFVPNEAREEEGRTLVAPENFASILYAGQPVADENDRNLPSVDPFTWRGVLRYLDSFEKTLAKPTQDYRIPDQLVARVEEPGYLETILPAFDAVENAWYDRVRDQIEGPDPEDPAERERIGRLRARAERVHVDRAELADFLVRHPTPASIVEALRDADRIRSGWRQAARGRIAEYRAAVAGFDPDAAVPPEALAELRARIAEDKVRSWNFRWTERGTERLHVSFEQIEVSLAKFGGGGQAALVADYYVDPARAHLVPPELRDAFEPRWRRLVSNRPHRIGGYHDGLQSDAEIGPARELLLFQIASDDAMNWCWGDTGAYYVFIAPRDLERRDWSKAELSLECH